MPDSTPNAPAPGTGFPADNADGTPGLIGKDDYTKWEATQRINKSHDVVVVGNIADIQRYGGDAAAKRGDEGVVSPAQHEASRGEFTRETERVGLISAPLAPEPTVDNTPNSVDPTSQSPTVISGKSTPSTATSATKEK